MFYISQANVFTNIVSQNLSPFSENRSILDKILRDILRFLNSFPLPPLTYLVEPKVSQWIWS